MAQTTNELCAETHGKRGIMSENVVWTDGYGREVIKRPLSGGDHKYLIIYDDGEDEYCVTYYEWSDTTNGMLGMCRAVLADAEKESESE